MRRSAHRLDSCLTIPTRDAGIPDPDHENAALWGRIAAHAFKPPDRPSNVTSRTAREMGWDMSAARAAVDEYRRFCFLATVSPTPVTPSEAVDEVWHRHLLHTRDYWDVWCGQVLRRPLHHDTSGGGVAEDDRHAGQYARTLAIYESHFGTPPESLWPGLGSFPLPSRTPMTRTIARLARGALERATLSTLFAGLALLSGARDASALAYGQRFVALPADDGFALLGFVASLAVIVAAGQDAHVGEAVLASAREGASRAARAPLPGEVAYAFSLAGPDALAGTSLSKLRPGFQPRRSRSTGASSQGDSGGDAMTSLAWFGNSYGCDPGPGHSGASDGGHGHSCGSGGHSCGGGGHSCGSSCGSSCGGGGD